MWGIVYYASRDGKVPAEDFLDACPAKIDARFAAVLDAVRKAPPRLFCILDNGSPEELHKRGLAQPQIAVITGMVKDSATKFSNRDYAKVRRLGTEYLEQLPRRIAF